jgi:hypothetical protein
VQELIGSRKLFGPTFIYDGMDYCKVVIQEMRQLKNILSTNGIKGEIIINPTEFLGDDTYSRGFMAGLLYN